MFSCFCSLIKLKEAWIGGATLLDSMDDVELRCSWTCKRVDKFQYYTLVVQPQNHELPPWSGDITSLILLCKWRHQSLISGVG